jgi:predicted GIY-YIG superfamily endonuclease
MKWTDELLREEALKYDKRIDFQKGNASAYNTSIKRGILNEICSHMIPQHITWSDEMIKEKALEYKKRSDFSNACVSAYLIARKRVILDDVCSHMDIHSITWSNEMIKEEALKYTTRRDFQKGSTSYDIARRRGILDDVCSHMVRIGNLYKRFIYIIEFENNSVYIGLTNNIKRRKLEHIDKSSNKFVRDLINNNIKYLFKSDNILYNADDAIKIECELIEEYKNKEYLVLNIIKGGGLGNTSFNKWSMEIIQEESLKYKNKKDFLKNNKKAYDYSYRNGFLNVVCSHMNNKKRWTDDNIREEALKYKTKMDFIKYCKSGYNAACRKGILDEVCSHMI